MKVSTLVFVILWRLFVEHKGFPEIALRQSGKSASVQSTLGHSNVNFSIDLKNKCGRNDSTSVFSTSEASPAKNVGMHTESSRKSQDQQVFLSM